MHRSTTAMLRVGLRLLQPRGWCAKIAGPEQLTQLSVAGKLSRIHRRAKMYISRKAHFNRTRSDETGASDPITSRKVRVVFTHAVPSRNGLTEIEVSEYQSLPATGHWMPMAEHRERHFDMLVRRLLLLALALIVPGSVFANDAVKVFILAGQSNMEGHGKVNAEPKSNEGKGSLEWLAKNPNTAARFKHLTDADGKWIARDDVQIWYLGRRGKLTPGFGFREGYIGPELGFGHVVGDAFDEPVLLIKLAWGGKSLAQDFRPPSSGGEVGPYYQELLKLTKEVLRDAKSLFPQFAERKLELVGFGWHQGWNDRVNQGFNDQYEQNLANFIRDIRKDLNAPHVPFVIAETGMSGREEKHPRALSLMKAQAAVAKYDEFQGNVAFVGTRDFFRPKEVSPSGQAYHWNSNAETHYLIGEGMGKAMVKLILTPSGHAGDVFHIYAPSRTTSKLLIVEATPSDEGLSLKLLQQVELGFPAATITAHPDKPLLYVAAPTGDEAKTLGAVVSLDHDGSYLRHAPVTMHHGYSYLSLDRASRFLLGVNYFDGFVDVYALDTTGKPVKRVAALNESRRNAHCVLPSPDNRFVYIPYVKETNAIFQYRFDSKSGQLVGLDPKNANPPDGTGPRHMAYHPSKPIAYFSNEQHLGVSVYDMEKSGALKLRQVCDAVDKDERKQGISSSDIVITPDGRFLFAGIRGHQRDFDWISRYRVKPNGDVELLGLTPADKIPWGLALSPNGRYLLATAYEGATLLAFRIGDDGDVTRVGSFTWDKNISDLVTR